MVSKRFWVVAGDMDRDSGLDLARVLAYTHASLSQAAQTRQPRQPSHQG